jgi:hypothetical protein
MRRMFLAVLMLTTATLAVAQRYDYRTEDPIRRDRALFEKVRADLDHASGYPYSSRADLKRFDEARRELFDFESRFDQGRYDKHELDEAIDRLDKVVGHNSLDSRDRGTLSDDLRKMRDFREFRNRRY